MYVLSLNMCFYLLILVQSMSLGKLKRIWRN